MKSVALILGIPEAAVGSIEGISGIRPEKQSSRNRQICTAHDVRVANKARESPPEREFQLAFGPVNGRSTEGNGKAHGRIEKKVVVGVVIGVAPENVRIQLQLLGERLGQTHFIVVP